MKNIFPLSFSVMAAVAIASFIGAYFVYEHFWPNGQNAQTAATATDALRENWEHFDETGYVTAGSSTNIEGELRFSYGSSSTPPLSVSLRFTSESECVFGTETTPCVALSAPLAMVFKDKVVQVAGSQRGGTVVVDRLTVGETTPLAAGTEVSWEEVQARVLNCEAAVMVQYGSLIVGFTLSDGTEIFSYEPHSGAAQALRAEAESFCGAIPVTTH